ncbi:MAG: alpha/beta hydrolase [Gammaproteobacteria bacterium]|nr:alpha/beta hydrolase [Gammaproteobacteria bacterium]
MRQFDSHIEIDTSPSPTAAVIWLHGLGADGSDFVPVVPQLGLPENPGIRFLFPHAPVRPVTCNGGYAMRAWYDIYSLDELRHEDQPGLVDAQQRIEALIQAENERGIPTHRIVLLGFSQGGAVALYTGLRHPQRLAGIGALSSYLPLCQTPAADYAPDNRDTPVFIAHGRQDPVVAFHLGKESRERLQQLGYPVEWKSYDMEHSVCADEIDDISAWLSNCLR